MGMTVLGVTNAKIKLKIAVDAIYDETIKIAEEEAANMAMLASLYAPRDTGTLEDSIVVDQPKANEFEVRFEKGAVNSKDGTPVSKYGPKMERFLEPRGSLKRGKGTQAKGSDAGGGFLARAAAERIGVLGSRVARALKKLRVGK